jgi:NADPH-dependent 2,4-dienoyl-CoA reductase/sulfur reductase-like enzyme
MPNDEQTQTRPLSRRDFLRLVGVASSGLLLARSGRAVENDVTGSGPKRILILGAGLAGLVAAYELKRAGHQVTIREATLRAGGRVRTIREPFSDGLYAEAGAGRIPNTHNLTLDYAKRFSLQVAPVRSKRSNW